MKMIDISSKEITRRICIAEGTVWMKWETMQKIHHQQIEKGDVISAARLAGIMGAKRTPELIPLCHPIALTQTEVHITLHSNPSRARIEARTEALDRTGVEMEALTAVSVASLTIYDMLKKIDDQLTIGDIRLLHKSGGKSGEWNRQYHSNSSS